MRAESAAEVRRPDEAILTLDWYGALSGPARRAFWASFAGYGLAAFDLLTFTFVLAHVATTFGLSNGVAGVLGTSSLLASAAGGVLAGTLADGLGRVRVQQIAIGLYAVATFLCGLAWGYGSLLLFRVLLGVGFGGEWTASTLLVAEYAPPAQRGRLLGILASAFAVGGGLAAIAYAVVARSAPPDLSWRLLFWVGVLPALLVLWIRGHVAESPTYLATRQHPPAGSPKTEGLAAAGSFVGIFGRGFLGLTVAATMLATGALGGKYVVTVWLPTYLRSARDLSPTATSAAMTPVLVGSWLGYVAGGYCQDWLGRRRSFALYAVVSALVTWLYVRIPPDEGALLAVAGVPLGFCISGILSGLGAYLAELFPTRMRGAGQGFCYNGGRAIAAIPVIVVGYLAAVDGLGRAIALSALAYGLCLVAVCFLPETRGKALSADD